MRHRGGFYPCRVFRSRYPKTVVRYRDGRPWTKTITRDGGRWVTNALLRPVSVEALHAALAEHLADEPAEDAAAVGR
jgi:hypothetical protein